jgi:hypothetical protein
VPLVILFSMTFLTDINLGLRYVLPIAPYVFIATGKVAPWMLGLSGWWKRAMGSLVVAWLGLTIVASLWIYPSYLAYFNWASGGPDRRPARLIDSNLDWGQDLVGLREWCKKNIPGESIGLAYFGQINPSIFGKREDPFPWFLPPMSPAKFHAMAEKLRPVLRGPAPQLKPGYYAVSATLLYGLPWRLYDPADLKVTPEAWAPAWNVWDEYAFSYFKKFEPIHRVGHSIYIYHLSEADLANTSPDLTARSQQ